MIDSLNPINCLVVLRRWAAALAIVSALSLVGILAQGVEIEGRVTVAGAPGLGGAQVELRRLPSQYRQGQVELGADSLSLPGTSAVSDENGRFQLQAPSPGMWVVTIRAEGYVPLEHRLDPLLEPLVLPMAQLEEDRGLIVRTVDERGRPAPGIHILSRPEPKLGEFGEDGWRAPSHSGRSDDSGLLRLPAGESETIRVRAWGSGFAPRSESTSDEALELRMRPAPTLNLSLRRDGAPVSEAIVSLDGWPTAQADASGLVQLELSGARPPRVRVLTPEGGFSVSLPELLEGAPDGFEVELPQPTRLTGRVVEDRNRRAVAALVWDVADPGLSVGTDRRGWYDLPIGGPGRLEVRAASAGYADGDREFLVSPGESAKSPPLTLMPLSYVKGKVVDVDQRPIEGVQVLYRPLDQRGYPLPAPAGGRIITGADGRFRIGAAIRWQRFRLRATKAGYSLGQIDQAVARPRDQQAFDYKITLRQAGTVQGRVFDQEGRPLAGARAVLVESRGIRGLRPNSGLDYPVQAFADQQGGYEIPQVPSGRFRLAVRKAGFVPLMFPEREMPSPPAPVDLGAVSLRPGVALSGLVVDANTGIPIVDAEVGVLSNDQLWRSTSDAQGRFVIRDLMPDSRIRLYARADGFTEELTGMIEVARRDAPIRLEMGRSATMSGVVTDSSGYPVARAVVTLFGFQPGRSAAVTRNRVADAQGRFAFREVPPGRVFVSASGKGYAPSLYAPFELEPGQDLEGVGISLKGGATISGRIIDPRGMPLAGASIGLYQRLMTPYGSKSVLVGRSRAGSDGAFRLDRVEEGKRHFAVQPRGHAQQIVEADIQPGSNQLDLRVALDRRTPYLGLWRNNIYAAVSGRLLDESGEPASGVGIKLWPEPPNRVATATDAEGRFRLNSVPLGTYRLQGGGPLSVLFPDVIESLGTPLTGLEVTAPSRIGLQGRLLGFSSYQLMGLTIKAQGQVGSSPPWERLGTVDPEGRYRIPDLTPGTWNIVGELLDGRGYRLGQAQLSAGQSTLSLDLHFSEEQRFPRLCGRVLLDEIAVEGARIEANPGGGSSTGSADKTLSDGSFCIEGLKPGRHRLRVPMQGPDGGDYVYTLPVELRRNEEIELRVRTGVVEGRVLDSAGMPLSGVDLILQPVEGESAGEFRRPFKSRSDPFGRFYFPLALQGWSYQLKACKKGYAPVRTRIDLGREEQGRPRHELELRLDQGRTVGLQMSHPKKRRLRAAAVALLDPQGDVWVSRVDEVGPQGEVEFNEVPEQALQDGAGWRLRLLAEGTAPMELELASAAERLEVQLADEARLVLRLAEVDDRPFDLRATIRDGEGRVLLRGPLGEDLLSQETLGGQLSLLRHMPSGDWRIEVQSLDGRTWRGRARTVAGEVSHVTLELAARR